MKQPLFYTRIPLLYSIILCIIYLVSNLLTLGIFHNYLYDFCFEHKYWKNRRILYKFLKQKNLMYTKESILNNITKYEFGTFNVYVWNTQLRLTADTEHFDDIIGLFRSSRQEDRMVIKLIRLLNEL